MNRKWIFVVGIILLGIAFFVGTFKTKEPKENPIVESQQADGKDQTTEEKKGVFVGDQAYDFTLLDREGNEIKLSDLKGKIVYLNFFTTRSSSCSQEMPHIQEVYEQYKDKNVVFLAVNVLAAEEKDAQGVNEFLDEKGYTFPILYDVDGEISVKYKVRACPATYIIDAEGIITASVSQSMDKKTMIEKIENTLNK
ncbi:TlpA disulfide reductase family protein [Crassaminicella profunda]|uniref:TlpA disulfide reductase family protein n=1 Tax=Crassaminicella profunda TaxID=1286698 RepID=UPI001CA75CA0|nr:TlpA disulfide reductase family protein [Crassaminicella profunda]QZY55318.1 TlpA family protein disulfide reductase [Crassaminicella profunda]